MAARRNGIVRLRNLVVVVVVGVICVFVVFGCGSDTTLYLPWNLDVGNLTVRGNGNFENNLNVAGNSTVHGNSTTVGNSTTNGDSTTVGDNHTLGNNQTDGSETVIGNINHAGPIIQIPPVPPAPPPVVQPPPNPPPVCGNWVIEAGEQCDRSNFGSQTCLSYEDFDGGELICNATTCKIEFSGCTHPTSEPTLLMATLQSDNGSDHFHVGDNVKLTFTVSGGVPPYDNRCLFVDGTFATNEDSTATTFSFKEREARLKLINSPGAGVVTCEVTDARGETTSASLTIYVN